jgi:hypothetical protein
MAYNYGRWDAGLVFRSEFPCALGRLRHEYGRHGQMRRSFTLRAIRSEQRLRVMTGALRAVAFTAGLARLFPLQRKTYGAIYDITYWKGVSDELGGLRAVISGNGVMP